MEKLLIRGYLSDDEAEVIALWHACGLVMPRKDPALDIARKLDVQPEWFLVGELAGRIVATCMAGYEGHRGWLNYLAVAPSCRRQGVGARMVREAQARLLAAGCPKINLQVRAGNREVISFYEHLGFNVDEVVSLGKRLIADDQETP